MIVYVKQSRLHRVCYILSKWQSTGVNRTLSMWQTNVWISWYLSLLEQDLARAVIDWSGHWRKAWLSSPQVSSAFAALDKDRDGYVTKKDFERSFKTLTTKQVMLAYT